MKKISELASLLEQNFDSNFEDFKISQLVLDSRKSSVGSVFFAIKGVTSNGEDFIPDAIKSGSKAVILEAEVLEFKKKFPQVLFLQVPDIRQALAKTTNWFFDYPTCKQNVIAVTGTNGKTTTHFMVSMLLEGLRQKTIRLGTLGIFAAGMPLEDSLTTPDNLTLQVKLAEAFSLGIQNVAMEVSSHALVQERAAELAFDVGIFTNITRDHLDYHKDFEDYFTAKKKLFNLLAKSEKPSKLALICLDSKEGQFLFRELKSDSRFKTKSYGFSELADYRVQNFQQNISGSSFEIRFANEVIAVKSPYIGFYNALNLTAALVAVNFLGHPFSALTALTENMQQAPGRLENCGSKEIGVYVDYAHTPDALEKALQALRPLVAEQNKLYVLFGCGGDRDAGKRPLMALAASKNADGVIVTSDNPRTESPQKIIADILKADFEPLLVEESRAAAISKALSLCRAGDVLLIAGKGHENYQILGKEKIYFSDQEEVRKFFRV